MGAVGAGAVRPGWRRPWWFCAALAALGLAPAQGRGDARAVALADRLGPGGGLKLGSGALEALRYVPCG